MYPIVDLTESFEDNSFQWKQKRTICWHWDGATSARIAIRWQNERLKGEGTVVYNYIIGRDGTIFKMIDPLIRYAHHTGKGIAYDMTCIGIAISSKGYSDHFSDAQMKAALQLRNEIFEIFDVTEEHSHHELTPHKPDFPDHLWAEMLYYFKTNGHYRTKTSLYPTPSERIQVKDVPAAVDEYNMDVKLRKARNKARRTAVRRQQYKAAVT